MELAIKEDENITVPQLPSMVSSTNDVQNSPTKSISATNETVKIGNESFPPLVSMKLPPLSKPPLPPIGESVNIRSDIIKSDTIEKINPFNKNATTTSNN